MKEPLLRVEKLWVHYHSAGRRVVAVQELSFALDRGESLALVGESGSGKSSIALAVAGLIPPTQGEAGAEALGFSPAGERFDLLHLPADKWQGIRGRHIGFIFQNPMSALNPVWTCGEQVSETMRRHLGLDRAAARARCLEWFERVHLPEVERIFRSYPHELSGGQLQRVVIAMAMCCDPALLIADEPTTNLDSTTQHGILDLLKELLSDGRRAMLFISHDLGLVAEMSQRVIVLQQGREVERGTTAQVLESPSQPYTRRLLASRPPRDRYLRRLPVDEESPDLETRTLSPQTLQRRIENLQQQPPLLQVENLQTWFPLRKGWWGKQQWLRAVDGVSFQLFPGERLGVLGESGSGKTTLGRTLLRLLPPRSGRVIFQGHDLTALEGEPLRRLRPHLQVVFQNPYAALNPRQTVGESLMEPLKVHRLAQSAAERGDRALEMLRAVGLKEEHFHRLPRQLSGGQRQRVAIARALMTRPRLLVCDECVSSLDVSVQAQVLNLLLDLQERFGLALLFISHDLAVVRLMSDRVLVMQQGKIVETGPVVQVFENPRHPYTRRLLEVGMQS